MAKYEEELVTAINNQTMMMQQILAKQSQPEVSGFKSWTRVATENPKTTIAGVGILVCEIVKVFIPELHEKLEFTKAGLESYLGYKAVDASVKPKSPPKEDFVAG